MGKTEIKTKATEVGVADFIAAVPEARRREDAAVIDAMHRRVTGQNPRCGGRRSSVMAAMTIHMTAAGWLQRLHVRAELRESASIGEVYGVDSAEAFAGSAFNIWLGFAYDHLRSQRAFSAGDCSGRREPAGRRPLHCSLLPPNVRANRTATAGRLGPGWENVPRTPDRAKTARRSGSGGSARC